MTAENVIEDLDDPFDPHIADEALFGDHADPYPVIEQLRSQGPVVAGDYREIMGIPGQGDEGWAGRYLVLSFAAVDQVTNDPITFSNHAFDSTLGRAFGRTVSVMDPPEHTQHRRILQKAFRPPIVAAWGDDIVAPVIDALIGEFRDSGRGELVEQFARKYSFGVIYRMLDLPREHIDTFYKLTVAQLFFYPGMTIAEEASAKLGRYFGKLLAERRQSPGSDIVSVLATTELDGEYLDDEVAISFLRQLINAGGDTTFRTTTVLLTGLLSNPDQLDAGARTGAWLPRPSRRRCAGTDRYWPRSARRRSTPSSTEYRCRPTATSSFSTGPPTTTRRCSSVLNDSTSTGPSTATSASPSVPTTASVKCWPASR